MQFQCNLLDPPFYLTGSFTRMLLDYGIIHIDRIFFHGTLLFIVNRWKCQRSMKSSTRAESYNSVSISVRCILTRIRWSILTDNVMSHTWTVYHVVIISALIASTWWNKRIFPRVHFTENNFTVFQLQSLSITYESLKFRVSIPAVYLYIYPYAHRRVTFQTIAHVPTLTPNSTYISLPFESREFHESRIIRVRVSHSKCMFARSQ